MNIAEFPSTSDVCRVAGVDEAGRGPLAGPVVVAAVILPSHYSLPGLDDSKRLQEQQREILFDSVRTQALAWSVQVVDAREIEALNILAATLEGMRRSVAALQPAADLALVDGNRLPDLPCPGEAIIEGDHHVPAISAASILAKVTRDRLMLEYHQQYPQYGFDEHKGYPTPRHLARLREHGPCPIHRTTFKPVRELLEPGLI